MATILLAAAGSAIGSSIGGSVFGIGAAAIGKAVGASVGSVVDSMIAGALTPAQRLEGPRLDTLKVTTSTEGVAIPRVFGRMRVGGNVIWATDFSETKNTSGGSGKGARQPTVTTYSYAASFALALCEGPISGIGRVWADGDLMEMRDITWRLYHGNETQMPDPFIEQKVGVGMTPAYRGTAYIMFEELPLETYGNRIPQISVEVFRALGGADTAEGMIKAVNLIPGSGEFVYAAEKITSGSDGESAALNMYARTSQTDFLTALDHLKAAIPDIQSVSLVVSWFGTDLRCGDCQIMPGVEIATKITSREWSVNGVSRGDAHVVSQSGGSPAYGGTPADFSVVQAIQEIKARGLRVTFYPFILMDVASGNSLPDPYSDNAADIGQPDYPWRGRITCSPAAEYAGTVDKTAAAASQVDAFFGTAAAADFGVSGEIVSWTGGADWGLRRMILHYAHLCAAAGGVDAFLIGSELRGLTTIRSDASTYPAVANLISMASDVRGILGAGCKVSYAADWSEYFGHHPADGTGDMFFHLDPLWVSADVDFVGIDNYMPLSDWRDGYDHIDARGWPSIYDLD